MSPWSGLRAALTGNALAMAGEPFDASPFLPEPGAGLDALRDAARCCRGCDLWKPATQTVFGEGPVDAGFVLVGEVPGDREDREGQPFVGPAGRELDKALEAAGIDRAETYVTNAVKHFRFQERGKRRIHQKPDAKQIKACRPWLLAELDVLRPGVLVLLGATAAKVAAGQHGSGSWPSAAGRSTATSRRSSSPRSIRRRSCAAATARRARLSATCSGRTCARRRRRSSEPGSAALARNRGDDHVVAVAPARRVERPAAGHEHEPALALAGEDARSAARPCARGAATSRGSCGSCRPRSAR